MKLLRSFLISISLFRYISATNFVIRNDCPYTVWAASVPVGGGKRLDPGQAWNLTVSPGTSGGHRIWARTNCTFDATGNGTCLTGDCDGKLQCTGYGLPPCTLVEYALNQFNNLDFFDISLLDGFNVPMEFSPVSTTTTESKGCNLVEYTENQYIGNNLYISVDEGINAQIGFPTPTPEGCPRSISCSADINADCPPELRAPGGCNHPCTVFKNDVYCCTAGKCAATYISNYFKERCPDAYSYPKDDASSTFTCPGGTNYKVLFCPH